MFCGSATATTLPRSWFTPTDWNGKDSAVYRPTGKPVSPVRSDPRNIRQWKKRIGSSALFLRMKRMKWKQLPKLLDAEKNGDFCFVPRSNLTKELSKKRILPPFGSAVRSITRKRRTYGNHTMWNISAKNCRIQTWNAECTGQTVLFRKTMKDNL